MSISNTFRHPIDPKCTHNYSIIVDHRVSVAKLFIVPWPVKMKSSVVSHYWYRKIAATTKRKTDFFVYAQYSAWPSILLQ